MPEVVTPLDASEIRERRIEPVLEAVAPEIGSRRLVGVHQHVGKGNDVFEARFDDESALMIKRARVPEGGAGFGNARQAGRLLRERTDVLAPAHLDVPPGASELPVLVYWRIPLPTLSSLWESLDEGARVDAMRSWGALIARVHGLRLPGHGSLAVAAREPVSFAEYQRGDLNGRWRPWYEAEWHRGLAALDQLEEAIPAVAERAGDAPSVFLHNDLHMQNVLCRVEGDRVRCAGVLDLESAYGGPAEADLTRTLVLYGPGFGDLSFPLRAALVTGYGAPLDPVVVGWFRAWHLLNIGLHCARRELYEFAAQLADSARRVAELTRRGEPPSVY